jgi:hypothetical protein
MEMPIGVKVLTASACAVLLFVVATMIPNSSVHVGDKQLSTSEWWAIGAGPFLLIVALLFSASAVYMLRRSAYGRLAHIVAWISLSVSIPYIAGVTGVGMTTWRSAFISNLILTAIIALYLYLSKASRDYFRAR